MDLEHTPLNPVRVFKSIYRLDFPLCFALVDKLGKFAETMHKAADVPPFTRGKTHVELLQHVVTSQVSVGTDRAQFSLSLQSFDYAVEYEKGVLLGDLHRHPTLTLASDLLLGLRDAPVNAINRLGVRHWVLVERDEFDFDSLKSYIAKQVSVFNSAIAKSFPRLDDVGLIFEATANDEMQSRFQVGPYREAERERYFTIAAKDVKQALIVDADTWQMKIELPQLNLGATSRAHERKVETTVDSLVAKLLEALHA